MLQCDTVSHAWQPLTGTCTRTNAVLQSVIVNVFHLATDLVLLLLPVPTVLKLQADLRKKREFSSSSNLPLPPPIYLV